MLQKVDYMILILFGNKQNIRNNVGDLDVSLHIQLINQLLENWGR